MKKQSVKNSYIKKHNLKKNIIFGFHNPYLIIENSKLIYELGKLYNVYLFTTNHYLNNLQKKKILEFKKNKAVKDCIIFNRYFKNSHNLNGISMIFNYIYISKKIKNLSKKKFSVCILGSNVFMWERIITEIIINNSCKLLIYQPDMLTLPLITIKELYNNMPIKKVLLKVHKSRQLKINKTKTSSKKIDFIGIFNNKIELFERYVIGKIFFNKKFLYRELDLNTWMDTRKTRIDKIYTYFQTLKIYWQKIYPKVKVELINKDNNCKCKSLKNKKKLLFLSDSNQYSKEIDKKIYFSLKRDLNTILLKYKKKISQIDIKPHPGSRDYNNLKLVNFLKNEFKNLNINLLDKSIIPEEISCNYIAAIGPFGTGLFKIQQACNYCIVVGLTSYSKYYYILNGEDGVNSWLKLKNTKICYIKDDGSFEKNKFILNKKIKKDKTFLNAVTKELMH